MVSLCVCLYLVHTAQSAVVSVDQENKVSLDSDQHNDKMSKRDAHVEAEKGQKKSDSNPKISTNEVGEQKAIQTRQVRC